MQHSIELKNGMIQFPRGYENECGEEWRLNVMYDPTGAKIETAEHALRILRANTVAMWRLDDSIWLDGELLATWDGKELK